MLPSFLLRTSAEVQWLRVSASEIMCAASDRRYTPVGEFHLNEDYVGSIDSFFLPFKHSPPPPPPSFVSVFSYGFGAYGPNPGCIFLFALT